MMRGFCFWLDRCLDVLRSESGLQQTKLTLDGVGHRRLTLGTTRLVNCGIEASHLGVQLLRSLDQPAQRRRQQFEVVRIVPYPSAKA